MPESAPNGPIARHVRRPSGRPRTFAQPVVTELTPVLEPTCRDPFMDGARGRPPRRAGHGNRALIGAAVRR